MKDVKAGKYTTMDAARIAAGGIVESQIDPITGMPAKVIVDPTQILEMSSEHIDLPYNILLGASEDGNAVSLNPDDKKDGGKKDDNKDVKKATEE